MGGCTIRAVYVVKTHHAPRCIGIALLVAAATVGAGAFLTYVQTPLYTSSALVLVTPDGPVGREERDMATRLRLFETDELLERAARKAALAGRSEELSGKLGADAVEGSDFMEVKAVDPEPTVAAALANGAAEAFVDYESDVLGLDSEVVERAVPSDRPSSPDAASNMIVAGLLGLVAGIAATFLFTRSGSVVKRPAQLEATLDAPVVGVVPELEKAAAKASGTRRQHRRRSTGPHVLHPDSVSNGSFRQLCKNIRLLCPFSSGQVIGVTSLRPGEGKSTVAANTATSLALSGMEVVLVGADLHKPVLHEMFSISPLPGVTDVLAGSVSLSEAIADVYLGDTGVRISLLPVGSIPPNPSVIAGSNTLSSLLDEVRAKFDVVVLDLPAALEVRDPVALAADVDGMLVVVRSGTVRTVELADLRESISTAGGAVLGGVLNRAGRSVGRSALEAYTYPDAVSAAAGYPGRSGRSRPGKHVESRRGRRDAREELSVPSLEDLWLRR